MTDYVCVFSCHQIHVELRRLEASLTKSSKDLKHSMSDLRRQVKLLEDK